MSKPNISLRFKPLHIYRKGLKIGLLIGYVSASRPEKLTHIIFRAKFSGLQGSRVSQRKS